MGFRNPVTSLSADQITPGTLGPGVLLPADQVSAGTLALEVIAQAIAAGTVGTPQLDVSAVTALNLAPGAVTAGAIVAGAVYAGAIAAGAVGAAEIAATAIDGKTITGALIRTAVAHQRIEMGAAPPDELRFYSDERFTDETSPGHLKIGYQDVGYTDQGYLELATPEVSGVGETSSALRGWSGNAFTDARWEVGAPLAAPNLTGGQLDAPHVGVELITTAQAVPATTYTAIAWNSVSEDTAMRPAGTPTRLVAPVDGLYLADATLVFEAQDDATKTRGLRFKVNTAGGVSYRRGGAVPSANSITYTEIQGDAWVRLLAGEYVEVQAWSSTAINVLPDLGTRATLTWRRR